MIQLEPVQNSIALPRSAETSHIVPYALGPDSQMLTQSPAKIFVNTFDSFVTWLLQLTSMSRQNSNNSFKPTPSRRGLIQALGQ